MIFERRAYTMEPGHIDAFDKAQIDRGFDLVKPYMDRLVGYFSTRTGVSDQIVHLYRYDDLDDWNKRLRGLYHVPELTPYFVNTRKIVRRQQNGFYEPLPIDPINPLWGGGNDWLPGIGKTLAPLSENLVVEEKVFQLKPGGIPAFVEACNQTGVGTLDAIRRQSIGTLMSMIGNLHTVAFWWWFETSEDRETHAKCLSAAAEWNNFIAEVAAVTLEQSSLLLEPRPIPQMSPLFS